jgi:hypothetical protein
MITTGLFPHLKILVDNKYIVIKSFNIPKNNNLRIGYLIQAPLRHTTIASNALVSANIIKLHRTHTQYEAPQTPDLALDDRKRRQTDRPLPNLLILTLLIQALDKQTPRLHGPAVITHPLSQELSILIIHAACAELHTLKPPESSVSFAVRISLPIRTGSELEIIDLMTELLGPLELLPHQLLSIEFIGRASKADGPAAHLALGDTEDLSIRRALVNGEVELLLPQSLAVGDVVCGGGDGARLDDVVVPEFLQRHELVEELWIGVFVAGKDGLRVGARGLFWAFFCFC